MDDLSEYFSDKDRIKALEVELELVNKKLTNEQYNKSKYKLMYERLRGEKELTRSDKARLLIKELKSTGKPVKLIRAIAKQCFLSEHHVKDLWYKNN